MGWNTCGKIRQDGGLGIRKLVPFNRALLLKWIWHFVNGDTSLWKTILVTKYVMEEGNWIKKAEMESWDGVWRSIHNEWETIVNNLHFQVGNG